MAGPDQNSPDQPGLRFIVIIGRDHFVLVIVTFAAFCEPGAVSGAASIPGEGARVNLSGLRRTLAQPSRAQPTPAQPRYSFYSIGSVSLFGWQMHPGGHFHFVLMFVLFLLPAPGQLFVYLTFGSSVADFSASSFLLGPFCGFVACFCWALN